MSDFNRRPRYLVTSRGLWQQRADLGVLLQAEIVFHPFSQIDAVVGWGQRPSGLRAERIASRRKVPAILLEDGFIKSYAPGRGEPAHSFVVDRSGIYFDARRPGDLSSLIDSGDADTARMERARDAIAFLRKHRLSKYNNAPIRTLSELGLDAVRPYVLLVDQVGGDASIRGALADDSRFGAMLDHAHQTYPEARLVIRAHPAAGDRSLLVSAARRLGLDYLVPGRGNPWPLLESAQAVYTVSSQLGFEALMAGRKVHCFGVTYYSHRGLTEDHCEAPAPRRSASLEQIFHAAYIDYSRYLDLHDRSPVSLERAMEQALVVREQRNRIPARMLTGGLSPWKRRALDPFLIGPEGPAIHTGRFAKAIERAKESGAAIAVWGSARPLPSAVQSFRIEDGFIRSRGLGVNLAYPCSIAMDGEHVYYDARGESHLERLIATHPFESDLQARAARLIDTIIGNGISKYNVGDAVDLPAVADGRLRILIPGQVEKDASIRFGSPVTRTNRDLVAAVRLLYPDAFLAYKEHPDVTSGLRSGGAEPADADLIVRQGDIMHWIGWCDRLETMTSLAGFEALIRGKPVGVHGIPFYAGWGLTDDRIEVPRRTRSVNREMLAAAALILYPFYIHPLSAMPCTVEDLVAEIALKRQVSVSATRRLMLRLTQSINRTAVKIRDGRN